MFGHEVKCNHNNCNYIAESKRDLKRHKKSIHVCD